MAISAESTLRDWLSHHSAVNPDAVALKSNGGQVTYGELHEKVRRLAGGLSARELAKGDVVAVQLPNIEEYVVAFLAVTWCGGIVQTLHMPYRQAELRQLLAHSGAKMAVCLSRFKDVDTAGELVSLAATIDTLQHVIAVGGGAGGALDYSELASHPEITDPPDITTDDEFLLLYTSGTTASPKGVPHSYRGFLGNALRSAHEMEIRADESLLSVAPFTHLYGLFVLHLSLATGASNALVPAFDPSAFLDQLVALKPNAIFAAPAHFAPFCAAGKITSSHLAEARFTCLSGSTVPPSLASQVDELMPSGDVIQLWGMSELQAGSFCRPSDPADKRMASAGRASPQTELRVVDDAGTALNPGQEGELHVKGPSVFAGYLNNAAETEAAFAEDGWFRTGDLAVLDSDGYLTLTGRVKEVINRGGVKYNPIDVEVELMALEAVESCAIVPYPDDTLGEKACLCVQLRPGASLALEDVTDVLSDAGIAKYKWPERLEFIDEMPLTPTRKIMRGKLRQQIA